MEGQNAIRHNKRISLSEQELVDCSANYLNFGCKGGSMRFSFRYIEDYGGISTETSYPYIAKEESCNRGKGINAGIKVIGYKELGFDEDELKEAVGKLVLTLTGNRPYFSYSCSWLCWTIGTLNINKYILH